MEKRIDSEALPDREHENEQENIYENSEVNIGGTLIWYYYICQRETWLMAHQINPDQDEDNVSLGRFIHEYTYPRARKELLVGSSKMDIFRISEDDEFVIGEVKKSSRFKKSARMQLAFYLSELKQRGIRARGELHFPREKKKEEIILNEHLETELNETRRDILRILDKPVPPAPTRISFCKKCAYGEFCWS